MSKKRNARDYSIIGEETAKAEEKGLIQAEWYSCPIPRQRMKELMKRKDGPAIRDTLIGVILMLATGFLAYQSWGTWWSIPAFLAYGTCYTTITISRWHECGHGTAFKTPWMNQIVYHIVSFLSLMQATPWRWSHVRHHTDTIIIGSDPEVAPRPPSFFKLLLSIFFINGALPVMWTLIKRAFGKLGKAEQNYIYSSENSKVFWEARLYLLILFSIWSYAIYTHSFLPVMFIGLPLSYGGLLMFLLNTTQHSGLHEDVLDHRLNSRTFYTNHVIRFLYWNMNYHMEHHMFPMVPYHALHDLHKEMKQDCPPALPSFPAAIKIAVAALWKQRKNPGFVVDLPLPPTARPYKFNNMEAVHEEVG